MIKPKIIAHYKMNDNAATAVVIDETGTHNGTYKDKDGNINTDTGDVAGKVNNALDFDGLQAGGGTDEYIEIPNHADFNVGTGDISVFAWVNSDDDSTYQVIVSKDNYIDDIAFRLMGDNKLQIFIDNVNLVSAVVVGINAWHFVGFTRKLGTTKLYIDGVERGSSASLTGSIDNAHNVFIGIRGNSWALPFNGSIDNVMFFSVELTLDEVRILFNAGNGMENLAELDQEISPRRSNLSIHALRRRYEFA